MKLTRTMHLEHLTDGRLVLHNYCNGYCAEVTLYFGKGKKRKKPVMKLVKVTIETVEGEQ